MNWIERILDPNGDQSMTRFAVLLLIGNAILMGWYVIIFGSLYVTEATMIMSAVSAIASGLKIWQKSQEKTNLNEKDKS